MLRAFCLTIRAAHSKRGIWAVLLVCAALSGCSTVQLAYNQAVPLSYWWLDDYFDFSDTQAKLVKAELTRLHGWHRQNELPAYAAWLQQMQGIAEHNLSAEQVCGFAEQIRLATRRLLDQSAEGLAQWAPGLLPEQLSTLAQGFEKDNRKWRKEWLDGAPQALAKRRLNKTVDRFEDFYGPLQDPQIDLLKDSVNSSVFDPSLAWTERLRRQQDMLTSLRQHASTGRPAAQVRADMQALLVRSVESPDPVYRARLEQWQTQGCRTFALVHNSMSSEQRATLKSTLARYEQDARTLAK